MTGIFIAIHAFGRNLKRNVHLHISTTTQSITIDGLELKEVEFKHKNLMPLWRKEIIRLFRKTSFDADFVIPEIIKKTLR